MVSSCAGTSAPNPISPADVDGPWRPPRPCRRAGAWCGRLFAEALRAARALGPVARDSPTPTFSCDDDVLRFGRLEIDRGARQVRVDGQEKPLTAYQYTLLLALAERAGRVLSRDAMMDLIKGTMLDDFDRSIDVHISRIRAAIEDDPKKPRRILTCAARVTCSHENRTGDNRLRGKTCCACAGFIFSSTSRFSRRSQYSCSSVCCSGISRVPGPPGRDVEHGTAAQLADALLPPATTPQTEQQQVLDTYIGSWE